MFPFRRRPRHTDNAIDEAMQDAVALLPGASDRSRRTQLLVEIAAGLLLDMRAHEVTRWPTERFRLLLQVLEKMESKDEPHR